MLTLISLAINRKSQPQHRSIMVQPISIQPKPLYIPEPREGLLNWLADVLVDRIIGEVEQEEEQKRLTDEASIAETR